MSGMSLGQLTLVGVVFGLRMLALKWGVRAPEPVDVPRHLKRRVLHGRRRARRPGAYDRRDARAPSPERPGEPRDRA